jgi:hypothetical protein
MIARYSICGASSFVVGTADFRHLDIPKKQKLKKKI